MTNNKPSLEARTLHWPAADLEADASNFPPLSLNQGLSATIRRSRELIAKAYSVLAESRKGTGTALPTADGDAVYQRLKAEATADEEQNVTAALDRADRTAQSSKDAHDTARSMSRR